MKILKMIAGLVLGAALLPAQQLPVRIVDGHGNGVAAVCPLVAQVAVTAANTTKVITNTAGLQTYICGFVLLISTAGTAQITSGTGTNCGTNAAVLTPAFTIGTTHSFQFTPLNSIAAGPATVSFDVCVTAVTGNVTGMISYVQF